MRIKKEQELEQRAGNGIVAMPENLVGEFFNGACPDPCDMIIGPCACGSSHRIRDWPEWLFCILLKDKEWTTYGKTWDEFCESGLNTAGTHIHIHDSDLSEYITYLIGDVNRVGGVCDDVSAIRPNEIISRYRVLLEE